MKQLLGVLVWVSVAGAVVGFVLPWAHVDVRSPEALRQITSTVQSLPGSERVTGGISKLFGAAKSGVKKVTSTVNQTLPPSEQQRLDKAYAKLKAAGVPTSVSGLQIPQMANAKNAKVAMALLEMFTRDPQQIGAKSYAVYVLPGLALLCGLLLTVLGGRRPVALGVAVLCATVAGGGFWKLLTTNTSSLFIAITIGMGLWLSLWAYAGLAVAGLLGALAKSARNR
ncbi:MAG: hypothetical protein HY597_03090 [Candidatus Omnitrophica bacterium]|nr:hypothetical protein [Candidatus Omnitrophota bacterium]